MQQKTGHDGFGITQELSVPELVNNPSYKKKSEEIAGQMEKENLKEELYRTIVD